jgi:hypothetical protein
MNSNPDQEHNYNNPLTRIRDMYTLSNTPEDGSETDKVMVQHFLRILAEIALAVASRKGEENS